MVKILGELNLPCEIKKIFLAARSHKFLQSKFNQFFLSSNVGKLKGFVEKGFIEIEGKPQQLTCLALLG